MIPAAWSASSSCRNAVHSIHISDSATQPTRSESSHVVHRVTQEVESSLRAGLRGRMATRRTKVALQPRARSVVPVQVPDQGPSPLVPAHTPGACHHRIAQGHRPVNVHDGASPKDPPTLVRKRRTMRLSPLGLGNSAQSRIPARSSRSGSTGTLMSARSEASVRAAADGRQAPNGSPIGRRSARLILSAR